MKRLPVITLGALLAISTLSLAAGEACSTPTTTFCALKTLRSDKALSQTVKFEKDPAGLALEAKNPSANVDQALQSYANTHQCTIESISMLELAKGLLQGSNNIFGDNKQVKDGMSSELQNMSKKYILVDGDKAGCMKKLDLKIPLKTYSPSKGATDEKTQ